MFYSIDELAGRIGGEVVGDSSVLISGLGTLSGAGDGDLTFLSNAGYRKYLSGTGASVVLLESADLAACPTNAIVTNNPYLAFARLSQLFKPVDDKGVYQIHESAVVDPGAQLDAQVSLAANVVVESGVVLQKGVRIGANSYIGRDCTLHAGVEIKPNVTLYSDVVVGCNSIVHSGSVIGADGFGYTPDPAGTLVEIAQLGGVRIGAGVSIGAATTIDRGAIEDTLIGDGVKIDNQVQIGHNCIIGDHTIICGCAGLVGSTRIGKHCVLAGGVGIGGDGVIDICDGVTVSGCTHVTRSINKPGVYSGGVIFSETGLWKRNAIRFNKLNELVQRVRTLEKLQQK